MRLANFQRVRGLDAEWKLLRCPTECCLPNLTPLDYAKFYSRSRDAVIRVYDEGWQCDRNARAGGVSSKSGEVQSRCDCSVNKKPPCDEV